MSRRTLDQRYAAMTRPGYKKQSRRKVSGVVLVQRGQGTGGKWGTEDGKWYLHESEHEEGGWFLFGPGVERGEWVRTLKAAVAHIVGSEGSGGHAKSTTPDQRVGESRDEPGSDEGAAGCGSDPSVPATSPHNPFPQSPTTEGENDAS